MYRRPPPRWSYDASQEKAWIEGIRQGQMDVFDTLYTAIVPSLLAFACRLVPAYIAEDAVQDVMIDLWTRHDTFVVQGSLRGYLFGAVRLRAANLSRRDEVARRIVANHSKALEPSPAADPSDGIQSEELQTAINEALATLPERSRLILTMHWIDGLSYPEIAETLGTSVDAAKKQGRRMELVVRNLLKRFTP